MTRWNGRFRIPGLRVWLLLLLSVASTLESERIPGQEPSNPPAKPYLSIVMCGRHDDKRGDYAGRLQNSLDFLLFQAGKFNAQLEVIVVEWNPLPNASRLSSLLRILPDSSTPVRVITVPRSFHQSVQGDTKQDFFEFMAKNVGARRANGNFVLFSNGDVLLSDEVMQMVAAERLEVGAFYRIARTELPGLMDPLAPLQSRYETMEELLGVLADERACTIGEKECPGEYNRGICEAKGQVLESIAAQHKGHEDPGFLPAAGDFFLVSRQVLHRMGGYHQVASTTHLDSMLVCKARGLPLRQVVLLRPCAMMHQRHPAPMQPLRFILPGWELTESKCAEKAQEASVFASEVGAGFVEAAWDGAGPSMDREWGFPSEAFSEKSVAAASEQDWQWYAAGLFETEAVGEDAPAARELVRRAAKFEAMGGESEGELRRRRVLTVLAAVREHEMKVSGINRWCAFEPYSRWVADEPTIPFQHWFDLFRSKTCREGFPMTSPVPPEGPRERWVEGGGRGGGAAGEGVYVSFVVGARHDDLRGDSVGRLQALIDSVAWGCERAGVRCEVVVCEWAPVEWVGGGQVHTAKLRDLLKVPAGATMAAARVITVDQGLHGTVARGSGSSFLEFHAKNVAARRALGEFVLLASSDVLLSAAFFDMLRQRRLDRRAFYRMPRLEVPGVLDPLAPLGVRAAAVEALAEELWGEVRSCEEGSEDCAGEYNHGVCEAGGAAGEGHAGLEDAAFVAAPGDFLLLHRAALHALGGYQQVPSTEGLAGLLVCKARGLRLRQVVLLPPCVLLHQTHPSPVASMRKALPGWEWSPERCAAQQEAARAFADAGGTREPADDACAAGGAGGVCTGGEGPSMQEGWGWPGESLPREAAVEEGGEEHWQWFGQRGWREEVAAELREREERRGRAPGGQEGGAEGEEASGGAARDGARRGGRSDGGEGGGGAGGERVVVCVTSTAGRVGTMEAAWRSIRAQTLRPDALYLAVEEGVALPEFIRSDGAVTVLRFREDRGPVHKLVECARREEAPGTAIITFDDDMVLDPRLAARLVEAADELPEAVVGFSGWSVGGLLSRTPPAFAPEDFVGQHSDPSRLPSAVDVLEGYAGVLYRRALVDVERLSDFRGAPAAARYADDVWISGWLAADGVERVVVSLEKERREAMVLERMFEEIWKQASSQAQALKANPHRASRNQEVAAHMLPYWA